MINAIESLNAIYRKLKCQRSVLLSDTALLNESYLSTFEAKKFQKQFQKEKVLLYQLFAVEKEVI